MSSLGKFCPLYVFSILRRLFSHNYRFCNKVRFLGNNLISSTINTEFSKQTHLDKQDILTYNQPWGKQIFNNVFVSHCTPLKCKIRVLEILGLKIILTVYFRCFSVKSINNIFHSVTSLYLLAFFHPGFSSYFQHFKIVLILDWNFDLNLFRMNLFT